MAPDHHHPGGVAARYRRVMEPRALEVLRRFFRWMNRGMVLLWRFGLGRLAGVWPGGFGRLLVIEHTGRRTGVAYRTPVNYTTFGQDIYCIAAFGSRTDWYRNALAASDIAVWLPDGRWEATAADASEDPGRVALMRRMLIDSGFAAPLFGLHPHRISDEQLATATASYRLLRVRPVRKQAAAADGPGDLAWVWILLGLAVARRFVMGRLRGRRRRSWSTGPP